MTSEKYERTQIELRRVQVRVIYLNLNVQGIIYLFITGGV